MTISLPPPDFRIHHLATRHAGSLHDRAALTTDEGTRTYGELCNAIALLATFLAGQGLRAGDRLMIVGESGATQLAAVLACSRLDAWAVIVNARLTAAEVGAIEAHCAPRLVLTTGTLSPEAAAHGTTRSARPYQVAGLRFECTDADSAVEPEPVHADAARQVAAIIYTSGSTGNPKGVMLTHGNLGYSSAVSRAARGVRADDHVYAALPISHVYGLTTVALTALGAGAHLQLSARFDVAQTFAALAAGVTLLHAVPAMYVRLLETHERGTTVSRPRLRFVHCGGAPLDPSLKRRVEDMLGEPVNNGYGMTEAAPTITMVPYRQRRDDLSVGHVIPGVEARIVDEAGQRVPAGEVGELQIRGPNVMKGYYKAPEQTAQVLSPDGWLSTGDLLRADHDGSLFVMGRLKELIIRSGFNVYPSEVEAALNAFPGVAQSCVVGRPDHGDEQVIAFVQPEPGTQIDQPALSEFLRARLAPYKRPQQVIAMPQLPVGGTGKIQRKALGDLARNHPH